MGAVYVLHGVADRDPDELVCMFFPDLHSRDEFEQACPGKYQKMVLMGISYDEFEVGVEQ